MARTKQTARKSTGGKAPRMQLASTNTNQLRHFLTSQQASGNPKKKRIFINSENTFSQFAFERKTTGEEFSPNISVMRVKEPSVLNTSNPKAINDAKETESLFLRLDFNSKFDGNEQLVKESRLPIDIVFALDVSGSMSCNFPDDTDNRNKLTVAKECLLTILQKLTPQDRFSIMTFNSHAHEVFPLSFCSKKACTDAKKILNKQNAGGGTYLTGALNAAFDILSNNRGDEGKTKKRKSIEESEGEEERLKRVFFLTDMESSQSDEDGVIAIAAKNAKIASNEPVQQRRKSRRLEQKQDDSEAIVEQKLIAPSHLTVFGIGVDLSANTVDRLSSLPGAKYISVINAAEFETITKDFDFDVTPVAFDIQINFNESGLSIVKGFGSSELNNLEENALKAILSSEFPVSKDESGQMFGGIYLFQLKEDHLDMNSSSEPKVVNLSIKWHDRHYQKQERLVEITLPGSVVESQYTSNQKNSSSNSGSAIDAVEVDKGIRKAFALTKYVQSLTDFAFDTNDENENAPVIPQAFNRKGFVQRSSTNTQPDVTAGAVALRGNPSLMEEIISWDLDRIFSQSLPEFIPFVNSVEEQFTAVNMSTACIAGLKKHFFYGMKFSHLKQFLIHEIQVVCGDTSLSTNNQNVIQTIDQVIDLSKTELNRFVQDVKEEVRLQALQQNIRTATTNVTSGSSNNGSVMETNQMKNFLCPITMAIMTDPVIASDGYTYERRAIEEWLQTHDTSPCTNDVLANKTLLPNFSLKTIIQEFTHTAST